MNDEDRIPPFVSAEWLAARPTPPVLVDLRWSLDGSQGRDQYLAQHLPGAIYVDLDTVAAAPPTVADGRHPLPSPEAFAASLGDLGIPEDATVVAYDQGPGVVAARFVWMLRAIGQAAAVLEGGMAGWAGPVEGGQETLPAVVREPRDWPAEKLADAAKTAAAAGRDDAVVLDSREPTRYTGEREPVDARPGHIPGARNVPVADHLDADGRLRDIDVLASRYGDVGALKANDVVAYCGSGVAACHNLLVLETLGVQGRLFPGSWSAWSADPARKVATGT